MIPKRRTPKELSVWPEETVDAIRRSIGEHTAVDDIGHLYDLSGDPPPMTRNQLAEMLIPVFVANWDGWTPRSLAGLAYQTADAMIALRK